MDNIDISKSKIGHIESLTNSIMFEWGEKDEDLKIQLTKLLTLIEEERKSRNDLRDLAYYLANKI